MEALSFLQDGPNAPSAGRDSLSPLSAPRQRICLPCLGLATSIPYGRPESNRSKAPSSRPSARPGVRSRVPVFRSRYRRRRLRPEESTISFCHRLVARRTASVRASLGRACCSCVQHGSHIRLRALIASPPAPARPRRRCSGIGTSPGTPDVVGQPDHLHRSYQPEPKTRPSCSGLLCHLIRA